MSEEAMPKRYFLIIGRRINYPMGCLRVARLQDLDGVHEEEPDALFYEVKKEEFERFGKWDRPNEEVYSKDFDWVRASKTYDELRRSLEKAVSNMAADAQVIHKAFPRTSPIALTVREPDATLLALGEAIEVALPYYPGSNEGQSFLICASTEKRTKLGRVVTHLMEKNGITDPWANCGKILAVGTLTNLSSASPKNGPLHLAFFGDVTPLSEPIPVLAGQAEKQEPWNAAFVCERAYPGERFCFEPKGDYDLLATIANAASRIRKYKTLFSQADRNMNEIDTSLNGEEYRKEFERRGEIRYDSWRELRRAEADLEAALTEWEGPSDV